MAAKPAKTPDVAAIEVLGGMVERLVSKHSDFIAVQTGAYQESHKSALEREASLSAQILELRGQLRQSEADLRDERGKNLDRDVAFQRLANEKDRSDKILAKVSESLSIVGGIALRVAGDMKAKGALTEGAKDAADPSIEGILDRLIGDLSPRTVAILWERAKTALLPAMTHPAMMRNVFLLLATDEVRAALVTDLGDQAQSRLQELARAAGFS